MGYAEFYVRFRLVLLMCALLIFHSAPMAAADSPSAEPFTDPGYRVEMEQGWTNKPVIYKNGEKDADLSVVVNQQLSAVLLPIVEKFATERKVNISTQIGTCGISAGALSRKEVDMGGFCCPPGDIDRMPGLTYHTLGITPLLLLVHKDVNVDSVSLEDARRLFSGEIHNWSEVGGNDITVRPMGMLHCKKRPGHWRLILGNSKLFSPEFKVTGDIEDTINMVTITPGSLGFEIMMNLIKLGKTNDLKVLKLDGHDPMNLERLKANKYPFYRTMNVTTWAGPEDSKPLSGELMRYMLKELEKAEPAQGILPASELRKAGWKFTGDELTGEPGE